MWFPLESHYGTWQDPVVRAEVAIDLVYLAVIVLLVVFFWVWVTRAETPDSTSAIALSVTSIAGVVLTIGFLIPLLPIPSGSLFRQPGIHQFNILVVLTLGLTPRHHRTLRAVAGAKRTHR